jgi:hypothetical protein
VETPLSLSHHIALFALTVTWHALPVAQPAQAGPTLLHLAHSHNDYEQPRALEDALAYRFASVEADIWLQGGELRVGHLPWSTEGTLQQLYLDPLQRRVDQLGSVYGDGRPFTLWIDIKSRSDLLPNHLRRLLNAYSMLTVFADGQIEPGPVTIVLTGDAGNKTEMVDDLPWRKVCRDHDVFKPADPIADYRWLWYGLQWSKIFSWNGQGAFPAAERVRLRELVLQAHAKGRQVRFWHTPETATFWAEALAAGVDLIGTDRLGDLARFLEAQPESGRAE